MNIAFLLVVLNNFFVLFVVSIVLIIFILRVSLIRIPSLPYITILAICFFLFILSENLAILFESEILARFNAVSLFFLSISQIVFLNYTIREKILSYYIIFISSIGILLIYLAFQPNVISISYISDYKKLSWSGLFLIIASFFHLIIPIYQFIWGLKIYKNSPLGLKKEALFLLLASIVGPLFVMVFYILSYYFLIFNIFVGIGQLFPIIIFFWICLKYPSLLMILPFKVYRLIVRNNYGNLLFNHDWSNSKINEKIFTGFLNAIEFMSEEMMKMGGLIEVNLQKGILTLIRTNYITVGLIASKVSKLLKKNLVEFSIDFEQKFKRLLKKSCIDITEYSSAYKLIKKHFPHIPYDFFEDENLIFTLTSKYSEIPKQLQNKYRNIFKNETEYDVIINDLAKSPVSMSSDFFILYDELKEELDAIDEENYKKGGKYSE
ncbi:MAG: hypothetical protein JXA99_11415 [Candidatus Lokiarchaeota archaeon]|nr:hypothetical protein [Candidatus Lokiarchaeota archaeon]